MSLDKLIAECNDHAANLIGERLARQGGKHADDYRIATEIAERLFNLGKRSQALKDSISSAEASIIRNKASIDDINAVYRKLQFELDVANHQVKVPRPQ